MVQIYRPMVIKKENIIDEELNAYRSSEYLSKIYL